MADKNEIVVQLVRTMLEFLRHSNVEWDQTYYRYVEHDAGTVSYEWVYRKARTLSYFTSDRALKSKYQQELNSLMADLYKAITDEGRNRPVVAVVSVDAEKNYNIKFDYANPRALEIGLLNLGTSDSYFGQEIDIPEAVIKMQQELKADGITEIPAFIGNKK